MTTNNEETEIDDLEEDTFEWVNTARCPACQRLRGFVVEKYNGFVVVLCKCDMRATMGREIERRGPLLVSYGTDVIGWCPGTDALASDGEYYHMPLFTAMGY
jgi:hypothetical protein